MNIIKSHLRTHSVARARPAWVEVPVPSWPLLLMYSFMWDFIVSGAHLTASSMIPLHLLAKSFTVCSLSAWVSFSMMLCPVPWPI